MLQTDLCGIKWRKLVWSESGGGVGGCGGHLGVGGVGNGSGTEPLDDPVLKSYTRCIANDILCVWRRVASSSGGHGAGGPGGGGIFDMGPPPPMHHPPLSLTAAKELWIFWYGEEPDLSELVAPELISPGEYSFFYT